ncbi:MAG: zinc ribbon domain-containing protein [Planctomycetota bacterium]
MPTYVYEVVTPNGEPGEVFEVLQPMSEPALTQHPTTGAPVRRVIQPPNIAGKWSESGTKQTLSNRNLAEQGFTKYVKTGDGRYEKTAGKGPREIGA